MTKYSEVELPGVEFMMADGIFIKQHSHTYDHASMLASGSIRVWQDDVLVGDFVAPHPIEIKAGIKHTFASLQPNTVVYCIHQTRNYGVVDVAEIHSHVSDIILSQEV
jgi:quercetin dioxygenase-like cupin family protein